MSFSEIPPPPEVVPGNDAPRLRVRPPGPQSRTWLTRLQHGAAPMGPRTAFEESRGIRADVPPGTIVLSTGKGSNVIDVDGNRYVDLAAGFGALLLGHAHPAIMRVLELQAGRLMQALGDVYPSDAKVGLVERLTALYPGGTARAIVGQSGADAVTAALKTAALYTGRPAVIAFEGSYHGLSYGPLAVSGLRSSYREPFNEQLNPHVRFVPYPSTEDAAELALSQVRQLLASEPIGAVLLEPLLGRGGVVLPPDGFLVNLSELASVHDALLIADEVWTGLGRSGEMLFSVAQGAVPDLICLGKGLGGGLPISACIGRAAVMQAWSRESEVVHTSTFAGAPLACATALATLDCLSRNKLVERGRQLGERWLTELQRQLAKHAGVRAVRGAGLMIGIELGGGVGSASQLQRKLLERGYVTTTGGGSREVLVLTPPLTIAEELLQAFVPEVRKALG